MSGNILKILHLIGLTNLSDEQVYHYCKWKQEHSTTSTFTNAFAMAIIAIAVVFLSVTDFFLIIKQNEALKRENKLSESQAYNLVTKDYRDIAAMASFVISHRRDFSIRDVETVGEGKKKAAKILVSSKGYIYDITFTVYYGLTWDDEGDILPKLLEVRKGKFAGLSDLAKEFIKK